MALITSANARELGIKSAAIRKERKALGLPDRPLKLADSALKPVDPFTTLRLSRVRRQLTRIDEMMLDEVDPQKLDRLASAQSRLAEQERILAGRPLPGSRRPKEEVEAKTSAAVAWLADSIDVSQVAPPAAPRLDPEPPAGPDAPTAPTADTTTGGSQAANQLPETPAP